MTLLRHCLLVILFALAVCCGCAGRTGEQHAAAPADLAGALPPIAGLDQAGRGVNSVPGGVFELLNFAPVLTSAEYVQYEPGLLELSAYEPGTLGWALFSLGGFPDDGTALPLTVEINRSTPCWLAVADYSLGTWRFFRSQNPGQIALASGELLISPAGNVHVAVLAYESATEVTSLKLHTTADLPGGPAAVLTVLSNVTERWEARFSAANSSGGDGTITEVTYDFGDGTAPVVVTDPAEIVTHTYAAPGTHNITLTVENDALRLAVQVTPVEVASAFRELLVVYNSSIPASLDLAQYYCSPDTGRAIDPDYMLGLPIWAVGDALDTDVTRIEYNNLIRDPLRAHLDSSSYKNTIKYIVLMKGVPHRITSTDNAAVDSELCLLYANAPTAGRLYSGTAYEGYLENTGFFEARGGTENSFEPFEFTCVDEDDVPYTVSYLVGRISAYTYEEAKLSIDRSLAADTSGNGWVIMDSHVGWNANDTMFDPVFPFQYFSIDETSLEEYLTQAGYNMYADNTYDFITPDELPSDEVRQNVIGYTGWGVNHARNGSGVNPPSGSMYILTDFADLTYLPGACWIVYESFAGQSFAWNGDPGTHAGQGQICDFIRMGGTVAAGNTYEPYTDGVPDERRVFECYLLKGDRWIEACYKGMRYFSWHTIVLGDPLCRVVAD